MPPAARMLRGRVTRSIFTAADSRAADAQRHARPGAEMVGAALDPKVASICSRARELGRRQCNDVLVEAGPTLSGAICSSDWPTS